MNFTPTSMADDSMTDKPPYRISGRRSCLWGGEQPGRGRKPGGQFAIFSTTEIASQIPEGNEDVIVKGEGRPGNQLAGRCLSFAGRFSMEKLRK